MATKDISRSAVEGGRPNRNKYNRRRSHRQERGSFRYWRDEVLKGVEFADERAVESRPPVRKDFTDKLSPAYRWIASRCGRPWAEVFSELSKLFDTRRLSSWHIVYQHMLPEIEGGAKVETFTIASWRKCQFFVDDDGILQDRGFGHGRYSRGKKKSGPRFFQVQARVGKRRVRNKGESFVWMVEDGLRWVPCDSYYGRYRCWRQEHRRLGIGREHWNGGRYYNHEHQVTAYKEWRALTEGEVEWWLSVHESFRKRFTI